LGSGTHIATAAISRNGVFS